MSEHTPRLLFIVNSLDVGGAEKQVVTLLNRLEPGRFRLHLAYLKRRERLLPELHVDKLDEVVCCDVNRSVERQALRRLRELIAARNFDAIVCTNTYSMLYGSLVLPRRGPRPKLVTVFHSTLLQSYKEKAQMLLYQRLFRRCDLLLYVSENQRRYWRERGLRAVTDDVVHNGIDVEYFTDRTTPGRKSELRRRFGFTSQDYVIGLCSSLRPEKSAGDLVRAIQQLRAFGVPAKGLLIGDGPERMSVERTILELGLRDHVRITGLQADVRPYIASCDVMTLVSATETFSLAALESMALGKAMVMSDVGGASEQVLHGQNGFLFEPGDIDALVLHLTSLTSEPLRAQMGAVSARLVRQLFTVDAMTTGFTECMTRLLDNGSARDVRAAAHPNSI